MSTLFTLACAAIEDFLFAQIDTWQVAAWLPVVPLDPTNHWDLSDAEWILGARWIVHRFATAVGISLTALDGELQELGHEPLQAFVEYLVVLATEAQAGHAASQIGSRSLASIVQPTTPAEVPSPLDEREVVYRVWFATNRMPKNLQAIGKGFSNQRDTITHFGLCDVFVPSSHQIGSAGSALLWRLLRRVDDRLTVRSIVETGAAALWAGLQAQLATAAPGKRHAVLFIHGYNVSFADAAVRAAQIGFDLGIEAMGFFSWPSKGTIGGYLADGSSIEASEEAITDFLVTFANHVEAEAIHVIAHSMGNRGLLRAVNRIAARAELRTNRRFDQFVLAAADVDSGTFRALAKAYGEVARRTTLYVSSRDRALNLSAFLSDYPRIGFWPPVAVITDIDTISVSNVDLSALGHGYIAQAREVLTDLHQLLFTGLPPQQRFSVREARTETNDRYWTIGR